MHENYERILLMLEASPLAAILYDQDCVMVDCNMETCKLFGYTEKSVFLTIFQKQFYDFSPPHQPCGTPTPTKRDHCIQQSITQGRIQFEWMHCTRDGTLLPVHVTLSHSTHLGETVFVAYLRDLREEKAKEEQAREARAFADALYEASPMFIDVWDEDYNLVECNDKVTDLLGVPTKEEFLNNLTKYNPTHQPNGMETVAMYEKYFQIGLEEGYVKYPWTHLDVNGEEVPLEVTYVRHMRQGKRIMVGYNYDLRDIKKLEKQRLEAIEASNQAKSRFLARMSHEIRTPIAAVLGISEIQLRAQGLPPLLEEAFAKIYDSSKTLLSIVNDILDFSKIESGKMPIINSEYDVASLISDAAQLHLVYLERNKDVAFHMHVSEELPAKLIGDALRIRQVINNLLTNAFKYTDEGTINLSLACEAQSEDRVTLVISIQDTGIGMTPDQVAELSGEYTRFHEQERPFVSGTGLGLPIVYNLVQMMDAQLDITSQAGQGTRAMIRIPQQTCGAEVIGRDMAANLKNCESKWRMPKDFEFTPDPIPHGTVLVVDDVDTNLYVAEAMLQSFGMTVDMCENAYEAINKVKHGGVYDVIFMDHMMPGMDGVEATAKLRAMGYDRPIVALTANAVKGQSEMFMENGFSGFMSKPIDIKLLHAYLVRFIKEKG